MHMCIHTYIYRYSDIHVHMYNMQVCKYTHAFILIDAFYSQFATAKIFETTVGAHVFLIIGVGDVMPQPSQSLR